MNAARPGTKMAVAGIGCMFFNLVQGYLVRSGMIQLLRKNGLLLEDITLMAPWVVKTRLVSVMPLRQVEFHAIRFS